MVNDDYTPEADTTWGLIYRLNYLWAKVDREALAGHYNTWELTLDTIWRNLLYRQEIEIEEDSKGEIQKVKLSSVDIEVWGKIKENIRAVKRAGLIAQKNKDPNAVHKSKIEHYNAVMLYDIWLRKFMHQELKLYMKESESNPSMAMFGRNLKRKGK